MKTTFKITAKVWEYEKNGKTKWRYATLWTMFENEDGSFWIQIDSLPLNRDGRAHANKNLTKEEREEKKNNSGSVREAEAQKALEWEEDVF